MQAKEEKYEVIENAGMFNEREVDNFKTYSEAKEYVDEMYSKEEIEELKIDITRNHSTEY